MCTYISAIVPKGADVAHLSEVATRYQKGLRPFANRSIQSQIESGESLFLTSLGHCDCGSAIGSDSMRRINAVDLNEERLKLAKKGWSKAKIERSLSQRADKASAREQDQNTELGKDLDNWLGFLRAALSCRDTPYIGLLVHHYSGDLATETVAISGRQIAQCADLDHATLASISEDLIYQISAHA